MKNFGISGGIIHEQARFATSSQQLVESAPCRWAMAELKGIGKMPIPRLSYAIVASNDCPFQVKSAAL